MIPIELSVMKRDEIESSPALLSSLAASWSRASNTAASETIVAATLTAPTRPAA